MNTSYNHHEEDMDDDDDDDKIMKVAIMQLYNWN